VAEQMPRGRVLSLAEGEGRNAAYLAGLGCDVVAVDSSAVGLQKAEALAHSRHLSIQTQVQDLDDFDLGVEQWDAIVSIFCHLPQQQRAILHAKVVDALNPGGVLVLEAYIPRQLAFATGGPASAELMMSLESLQEELQGLQLDIAQEIERDVMEGKYHHGRAAVVQVLAKKAK
jgi:cyclopropane fatty-acyl-phospholipid synthase-like methyltransferase